MNRTCGFFLATVSAVALSASGALAQTAAPKAASGTQIEELVVTAQKREQALNDIPIAISALSSDQLEQRQVKTASDLSRVVPGFTYADTGVNAPVYSMRGVGYFDYSLSAQPAVSVYMDEVPLTFPAMTNGANFDLQRVEVLKGPQGTLYGQNSTGGLVNYIAKKPTRTPEAGLNVGYGSYNRVDLGGYASGAFTDSLRARVAVTHTSSDGWQQSLTRSDSKLGKLDKSAGRVLVDWDVTDRLTASFNLNGYVDKSEPTATQAIARALLTPARALPVVLTAPLVTTDDATLADWNPLHRPYRDDRFVQASARLGWRVTDSIKLTSISAYSNLDSKTDIDRDGMANQNSEYFLKGSIHSLYQELRLQGDTGILNWTVGGSYGEDRTDEQHNNRIDTSSNVQNVFGFGFGQSAFRGKNFLLTQAAFASGDWKLNDKLTLTTGIRYTDVIRKFVGCTNQTEAASLQAFTAISAFFRARAGLPAVPYTTYRGCSLIDATTFLATEVNQKVNEDNVSWRVALDYKPTDNVLLYASATKGYKGGNSITVSASTTAQFAPVRQESVMSYEGGFKATLLDRTMQLNGATFYYDYKDKQTRSKIPDPAFGTLQALVNIPKSHAYGAELEMQWLPIRDLTVNAGAAYLKTKVDRWTGYTGLGVLHDFAGAPFSFAPKWQLNLDVDKKWDMSERMQGFVGGSLAYRSKATADFNSDPLFNINSYTLLDLRAGVQDPGGKWRLSAFGNNVTNEYYWHSVVRVQDTVVRYPGMPSTWGVALNVNF